jgi:hypothetical protein
MCSGSLISFDFAGNASMRCDASACVKFGLEGIRFVSVESRLPKQHRLFGDHSFGGI